MGFRLYYESLEQAERFLAPALERGTGVAPDLVKLSRLTKKATVGRRIAESLGSKDPDFLFTQLIDGTEEPLLWGEITTAVETEDHLLQRFDSIRAAAKSHIPFALVHSPRTSSVEHGGQTRFNRDMAFSLAKRTWDLPCFDIIWPTTSDGLRAIRDESALACPTDLLGLDVVLRHLVDGVGEGLEAVQAAQTSDFVWQGAEGDEVQQLPAERSSRLFREAGRWVLKFNRWDHAMDPERGMASYWSVALNERLSGRLHDKTARNAEDAAENFVRATGIAVDGKPGSRGRIDVTAAANSSRLTRPGKTILESCSDFAVCDRQGRPLIHFEWNPNKLEIQKPVFSTAARTAIEPKHSVDEDEVTYCVAHQVVPTNSFITFSVSYPGAQGDLPILEGGGRGVRRTYFDLIAMKNDTVLVVESKGSQSRKALGGDVAKLARWREPARLESLLQTLGRGPECNVILGIAYPGDSFASGLSVDDLDFEIVVSERNWRVKCLTEAAEGALDKYEGKTLIPSRSKLSSSR